MASEYGLDCSKVTWVVDDEEAVPELKLPGNVVHAPAGESLVSLYGKGGLDAAFLGPAGLGRQGPPLAGWGVAKVEARDGVPSRDIFENGVQLEADWHRRTGIYPHHGLLVVKDSVLAEAPWVAQSLFEALTAAKNGFVAQLRAGTASPAEQAKFAPLMKIVGDDPLPYGLEANRPSLEALADFAVQQGLMAERLPMERMFVELN
jgi:4,5-dihydroxyphthalate decarboxylase